MRSRPLPLLGCATKPPRVSAAQATGSDPARGAATTRTGRHGKMPRVRPDWRTPRWPMPATSTRRWTWSWQRSPGSCTPVCSCPRRSRPPRPSTSSTAAPPHRPRPRQPWPRRPRRPRFAGSAAAQPLTEHPAPPNQKPRTADERAEPWKRPPAPKLPQPTGPSGWQRAGHALADWIELRTQRTRTRRATPAEDSDITVGALIVVSVVTLVVCALAFALSFSMMLAAARLYGWNDNLAKLFPILIDVGAIGGTFMGAISANRTYVHVGRSVLTLTLAASVLFNLVGHDVRGGTLIALPERWKWTGTVAAVFIPIVLAYFVHAFSKALKAYMDQRRAQKAAAEAAATAKARRAEAERAQQRQLPVAPVADRVTAPVAAMPPARVVEQPKPPAPAPVAVPQQRPAARPVPRRRPLRRPPPRGRRRRRSPRRRRRRRLRRSRRRRPSRASWMPTPPTPGPAATVTPGPRWC